jgi:hypothetical protein
MKEEKRPIIMKGKLIAYGGGWLFTQRTWSNEKGGRNRSLGKSVFVIFTARMY